MGATDPRSVAGKPLPVEEEAQLLVVGAGAAGLAAALEGVRLGLGVVLVEESPVPAATMGLDIPLHFGGRVGGAARNRNAMLEAVLASDPAIAEAFEAGVDVRLGTSCWGLWSNNASVGWLPGLVAGLAEQGRAWMLRAERIIVAAGRRDMGLAFPGWELPGVMGALAAERLVRRYGALDARRVAVLGTGTETVAACRTLQAAGVEVAALIEQEDAPADPDAAALPGTPPPPLLLRHAPRRVLGGADGVEALAVGAVTPDGRAVPGTEQVIACDAVLLGVGAVPAVELLDALGARTCFDPLRGGYVPALLDDDGQTSVPGVYAAGDCAGIWPSKTRARSIAEGEGRRAARAAAAAALGQVAAAPAGVPAAVSVPDSPRLDLATYRLGWVRACVIEASATAAAAAADDGPHVCQCEGVTAREILEVRPPRYLGWEGGGNRRNAPRDLRSLLQEGPPDPDQVKRLTRAGMGLCQGRRCREQVAALLALGTGVGLHDIAPATHRAPVRPLPLSAAAETAEPAAMTDQWDTWFGMPAQYLPPWEVAAEYTAAGRGVTGPGEVSSE